MDMKAVEAKWQQKWEESGIYKVDLKNTSAEDKFYTLVMFSYPSGDKLHVGHWYNYGPTDTYARFKKMSGKTVFQPMGFDAFGLPAENYAIKTGVHPQISTTKNIETMTAQLKSIGAMYDWNNDVVTCTKEYYRWNQWLFLKLYEKGLAYRAEAPVNWCPKDRTVLANEQVSDGCCERCGTTVIRKNLTQWFFKITAYAEELLKDLDTIDWPESTKAKQREWIGKSTGAEIEFAIKDCDKTIKVFTTRPDTLAGATFLTFAPESALIAEICSDDQRSAVELYIDETKKRSEVERLKGETKTGVFTGAYAINPLNGAEIPIWISDYVLITYGTGAVMAVPAHDQRDFEFATKFKLPIKKVVLEKGKEPASPLTEAYSGSGILINSGEFDGVANKKAVGEIVKSLGARANFKTNYKLRDWLISRQRYWGTPIPIAYNEAGEAKAVVEEQLPVELPLDVAFNPDGDSPLKTSESFKYYTAPNGEKLIRETDTMDTFVCSSWYYLRYVSPFAKTAIDTNNADKWAPVDKYVGGSDHSVMHLLYARFIHKALRDMGYVHSDEPFQSLTHQGMILGPDGQKMSKSKGNVVNPDDYVSKYGADIFRCSLMFGFAYELGGPWDDSSIQSIVRLFGRIERLFESYGSLTAENKSLTNLSKTDKKLLYVLNHSIKGMTEDLDKLQFNTSISRLMEIVNELYRYTGESNTELNNPVLGHVLFTMLKLFAPLAPHTAEELWEKANQQGFVTVEPWPEVEAQYLVSDDVHYVVQFNGKKRFEIELDRQLEQEKIQSAVEKHQKFAEYTAGKSVVKFIIVPNKLVNVVLR
jgi:leucyl-tRNA synthetase